MARDRGEILEESLGYLDGFEFTFGGVIPEICYGQVRAARFGRPYQWLGAAYFMWKWIQNHVC